MKKEREIDEGCEDGYQCDSMARFFVQYLVTGNNDN